MTCPAAHGGGLVHYACGHADELVLGPLCQQSQLLERERQTEQVVQGERDRALDGSRGRKSGADRHVAVDPELHATEDTTRLAKCPDDAENVGRPAVSPWRERTEAGLDDAGPAPFWPLSGGDQHKVVIAPGGRRPSGIGEG